MPGWLISRSSGSEKNAIISYLVLNLKKSPLPQGCSVLSLIDISNQGSEENYFSFTISSLNPSSRQVDKIHNPTYPPYPKNVPNFVQIPPPNEKKAWWFWVRSFSSIQEKQIFIPSSKDALVKFGENASVIKFNT